MNHPDPTLVPFLGTRDDFFAYLAELSPEERSEFLDTLPAEAQQLAGRPRAIAVPPMPDSDIVPESGWRFRVRNGGGGQRIYLRSAQPDLEVARGRVIARAKAIWAKNDIRTQSVSAALVSEQGCLIETAENSARRETYEFEEAR